jgi:hypothetical protein
MLGFEQTLIKFLGSLYGKTTIKNNSIQTHAPKFEYFGFFGHGTRRNSDLDLLLSTFFDLFSPVLFLFTRPTSLARLNSKTR